MANFQQTVTLTEAEKYAFGTLIYRSTVTAECSSNMNLDESGKITLNVTLKAFHYDNTGVYWWIENLSGTESPKGFTRPDSTIQLLDQNGNHLQSRTFSYANPRIPNSQTVDVKSTSFSITPNQFGTTKVGLRLRWVANFWLTNINEPTSNPDDAKYVEGVAYIELPDVGARLTVSNVTSSIDQSSEEINFTYKAPTSIYKMQAGVFLYDDTPWIAYDDNELEKPTASYQALTHKMDIGDSQRAEIASRMTPLQRIIPLTLRVQYKKNSTSSWQTLESEQKIYATISDAAAPTFTYTTVASDEETIQVTGTDSVLINGKSTATVTITPNLYQGARVASCQVTNGGITKKIDSVQSASFSVQFDNVQSPHFSAIIFDNMGYFKREEWDVDWLDYFAPTAQFSIPNVSVIAGHEGELALSVNGLWWNGSFGTQTNSLTGLYRWRKTGASWSAWRPLTRTTTNNNSNYILSQLLTGLDFTQEYDVQMTVNDSFNHLTYSRHVVSLPIFDFSASDFRVNGEFLINQSPVRDWVCGQGEDGFWKWKWYNSGKVEITYSQGNLGSVNFNTPTGAIYVNEDYDPMVLDIPDALKNLLIGGFATITSVVPETQAKTQSGDKIYLGCSAISALSGHLAIKVYSFRSAKVYLTNLVVTAQGRWKD